MKVYDGSITFSNTGQPVPLGERIRERQRLLLDVPATIGDDGDERYTTLATMLQIKALTGVAPDEWDVDAAACEESHWADCWFGKKEDGLRQRWWGKVFVNPPFSDVEPWVGAAFRHTETEDGMASLVAMLLPSNRTEQPWWQDRIERERDGRSRYTSLATHFLAGRTRFGHPGNREGHGVGSPPFGCLLLVFKRLP